MKKLVILIAGFLLVGLIFGYLISIDSGYVLFSWGSYTIETSFWFFNIMLAAFFISAYLVLRFVLLLIGKVFQTALLQFLVLFATPYLCKHKKKFTHWIN